MKVLDLFSGIGGFSLGLKRAGMEIIGFCEVDPYCNSVLKKNFKGVPVCEDINSLNKHLQQISYAEDSLAKISALPGKVGASSTITAPVRPLPVQDSSGRWCEPFAWFNRDTQSWRTWQRCLIEGWELYSEPFPRSGIIRNGIAFRRVQLDSLTKGTDYGLFATPTAVMPIEESDPSSRTKILPSGRPRKVSKQGIDGSMNWCQEMLHYGLIPTPGLCEFFMGYKTGWTDIGV